MKYKVSLLPEQNRKRLNGKKKLEKIKMFSLVVLVVLALFVFVVVFTSLYADKKLAEAKKLDNEYAQKVAELEQFREINANLQQKVQLIEDIQVDEPSLVNFIAKISNFKHPGVSIESIECADWKVSRVCTLSGICDNREQYISFEEAVKELEGVASVTCSSYEQGTESTRNVKFTIVITCSGGAAPVVTTTQATTTDGTQTDTTEATDIAVE